MTKKALHLVAAIVRVVILILTTYDLFAGETVLSAQISYFSTMINM